MTTDSFAELRREALDMVRHLLEKRGEFLPVCMVAMADGELSPFMVQGDDPDPDATTLIGWYGEELAALAGEGRITASAIAVDIRKRDPASGEVADAVLLILRAAGQAQDETVTYTIKTQGRIFKKRSVTFGETDVTTPDRNEVFG